MAKRRAVSTGLPLAYLNQIGGQDELVFDGASFALNAMIEGDRVEVIAGEPDIVDTPSESGSGQKIARCPKCRIAVWSNYAGAGDAVHFVRVGTLDEPDRLPARPASAG